MVDGVHVKEAFLRSGSLIRLGATKLRFELSDGGNRLLVSDRTSFGEMHGSSVPMRVSFALMEKAAASDATVLLEGETGTGKGQAAEAIHDASARARQAVRRRRLRRDPGEPPRERAVRPREGRVHRRADERRVGAFEEADGGTVFLDEIGELPLDLQPKLLRALESRRGRARSAPTRTDRSTCASIAATNRDLRGEVNQARFRADLFFRLAVVRIVMPPLRQRAEDMQLLVRKLLRGLARQRGEPGAASARPRSSRGLSASAWPGNVRELRNYLERCLVFEEPMPLGEDAVGGPAIVVPPSLAASATGAASAVDPSVEYTEARRQALEAFERAYVASFCIRTAAGSRPPRALLVSVASICTGSCGATAWRARASEATTRRAPKYVASTPPLMFGGDRVHQVVDAAVDAEEGRARITERGRERRQVGQGLRRGDRAEGAMVRIVKPERFRFDPCVWQKTRTSSQFIEISLPGTSIAASTFGMVADRHCSDMMPGCDATPDQRRRTRPSACSGFMPIVL